MSNPSPITISKDGGPPVQLMEVADCEDDHPDGPLFGFTRRFTIIANANMPAMDGSGSYRMTLADGVMHVDFDAEMVFDGFRPRSGNDPIIMVADYRAKCGQANVTVAASGTP